MAAPRIKKKQTNVKPSPLPRQGAIPCLVLLGLALVLAAVFFFASFRVIG